ncbi:hypothetical protein [Acinetobacter baumannii]|uniref:hypothetical protein n=1 Tax=Acinetobacter baumannii TaxID=470 RepID=UPI00148EEBF8|nr:hypothetical protein [Acinetobacter baumannii]MCY2697597.1 hypothetical protein [Acinetobacter baumannii]
MSAFLHHALRLRWWPFADTFWKPKSPRQDLVRAAALLIAEIERLDREVKAESKE